VNSDQRASAGLAVLVAVVASLAVGLWLGGHPRHLPGWARDAFVDGDRDARVTVDPHPAQARSVAEQVGEELRADRAVTDQLGRFGAVRGGGRDRDVDEDVGAAWRARAGRAADLAGGVPERQRDPAQQQVAERVLASLTRRALVVRSHRLGEGVNPVGDRDRIRRVQGSSDDVDQAVAALPQLDVGISLGCVLASGLAALRIGREKPPVQQLAQPRRRPDDPRRPVSTQPARQALPQRRGERVVDQAQNVHDGTRLLDGQQPLQHPRQRTKLGEHPRVVEQMLRSVLRARQQQRQMRSRRDAHPGVGVDPVHR